MKINQFTRAAAACLLTILAGAALGGDTSRKGTSGADQLLIPVGARSIATGFPWRVTTTGSLRALRVYSESESVASFSSTRIMTGPPQRPRSRPGCDP